MEHFKPVSGIQNSLPLLRQLLQDSSQVEKAAAARIHLVHLYPEAAQLCCAGG